MSVDADTDVRDVLRAQPIEGKTEKSTAGGKLSKRAEKKVRLPYCLRVGMCSAPAYDPRPVVPHRKQNSTPSRLSVQSRRS